VEASLVPVPPLPFFRSPRDDDALPSRSGLAGGSRTPVARIGAAGPGDGNMASAVESAETPALRVDDGRSSLTVLNEARDQAERIGANLEQVETATTGLAGVDRLLGRLRDMVVVAAGRGLEPPQRAVLQRGVDQTLAEIDAIANETVLDQDLLRPGLRTAFSSAQARTTTATGQAGTGGPQPFRQLGTAALGLTEFAVRSSDQALAAAGALDLATSRLERTASSLRRATDRFEGDLAGLTSPPVTATGELALGNTTAAFGSTIALRTDLLANPGDAMRAQSDLDVSRVFRLLDSSFK
jgi:flagellin-like hook-associated protein FlgL